MAAGGRDGDAGRLGLFSWALYDWANSPFTTLIITFVFPAYFAIGIVGDEVRGQALWGYAMAVSGVVIALASPLLGAIADAAGRRKPWLFAFTAGCVVASCLLWFARPAAEWAAFAVAVVILANVCFEFGAVFNNAMLPDLATEERLGRLSGWAWGLGYFGGLSALGLALVGFVQAERPWFGLSAEAAANVRVVGPLVGIWLAVFAWPLFAFTPDRPSARLSVAQAVRQGLAALLATFAHLRRHGNALRYLLAHMLYADGLVTLFAFGGIYAAGVFGMTLAEVILFGIVLNVTAGLGAFGFAWVDDRIGSKRTVLLALAGLVTSGLGVLLAEERTWFWLLGATLGIFVGPAQAASRTLLARIAPEGRQAEFFGLYALSGKATAFLGPALVGVVTEAAASQRLGLATVLLFWVAGGLLLLSVREPRPG